MQPPLASVPRERQAGRASAAAGAKARVPKVCYPNVCTPPSNALCRMRRCSTASNAVPVRPHARAVWIWSTSSGWSRPACAGSRPPRTVPSKPGSALRRAPNGWPDMRANASSNERNVYASRSNGSRGVRQAHLHASRDGPRLDRARARGRCGGLGIRAARPRPMRGRLVGGGSFRKRVPRRT